MKSPVIDFHRTFTLDISPQMPQMPQLTASFTHQVSEGAGRQFLPPAFTSTAEASGIGGRDKVPQNAYPQNLSVITKCLHCTTNIGVLCCADNLVGTLVSHRH